MFDSDNKELINNVTKELLALMADKTTHMESDIYPIKVSDYLDPQRHEKEREILFRRTPQIVAFTCEMPNAGDYKLHEETGVPMLITRTKNGEVKAFLNACRHRGAKLTEEPCGNQSRFICPYHAWCFTNDGKLAALPANDVFGDADKEKLGLIELPCEEKYGMIFAIATPGLSLDVDGFLGSGAKTIENWHFERNKLIGYRPVEARANWKLAMNTYGENYHFHVLHAKDFGYKVRNCAYHWRLDENERHWMVAWPSKSLEELRDTPESEWGDAHSHFSIQHYIYPNTLIALYPETLAVFQIYPEDDIAEQTTKMSFFSRNPEASKETEDMILERFEIFHNVLQTEDYWIGGNVQKNMESGLLTEMYFGRNEPGLIWMHEALDRGIGLNRPRLENPLGKD